MAQKPDGKPVGVEKVAFTRPAAERIAKVVRQVEAGQRDAEPYGPGERLQSLPYKLRLGTFTGNWEIGQYATVTVHETTQTVNVYNWCNAALGGNTSNTSATRYVIFGKVRDRQAAVEIQTNATPNTCGLTIAGVSLTAFAGYVSNEIQLLGHNTTGPCLQWYSVTTCAST